MTGLTWKQEKFCQVYVRLGDASAAYREAYVTDRMKPESIHRKAKEVKDNVKVAARIAELQGEIKQHHNLTVDALIAELEEARQKALQAETPQSAAAVSATMGKAKLTGLDKQLVELTGVVGLNLNKSILELFDDED